MHVFNSTHWPQVVSVNSHMSDNDEQRPVSDDECGDALRQGYAPIGVDLSSYQSLGNDNYDCNESNQDDYEDVHFSQQPHFFTSCQNTALADMGVTGTTAEELTDCLDAEYNNAVVASATPDNETPTVDEQGNEDLVELDDNNELLLESDISKMKLPPRPASPISSDKVAEIKSAMGTFMLPPSAAPEWAKDLGQDVWGDSSRLGELLSSTTSLPKK